MKFKKENPIVEDFYYNEELNKSKKRFYIQKRLLFFFWISYEIYYDYDEKEVIKYFTLEETTKNLLVIIERNKLW